ncbi:MAG: hypothetical protein JXR14_06205 [Paracoccaceae bacterium]
MGSHVHLAMFLPSRRLSKLVRLIECISGSSADYVLQPYEDIVARSVCGGWQIDMNNAKDMKGGSHRWVEYIATQHEKHPELPELRGKAFGISKAIGPTARRLALLADRGNPYKKRCATNGGRRKN